MRPHLGSSRAVSTTAATFVANGLGVGVLGGLLPTLADRWDTDTRALGALLVAAGLGAVVGISAGGRLSDRFGASRFMVAGGLLMAIALCGMGFAPSPSIGIAIAVLYGLGNGLTDVAMNALAVLVEAARPRPVMSRLHAMWSVGMLLGSGAVVLSGRLWSGPAAVARSALGVASVVLVVVAVLGLWSRVDTPRVVHRDESGVRQPIPRAAWVLAAMAVGFGLAEGTSYDWSSVHVRDVARVTSAQSAWGLAAVSVCMLAVRFGGDHLVHRFGRRQVVRWGAGLAALGYLIGVLAKPLPVLLLGWCVVGAGVALIAPQIYGLAGMAGGGRTLSIVVTTGYATSLIGPGAMGALVHEFGIQRALVLPLLAAVALSAMSLVMPTEKTILGD
ncbi:MFS transporter [Calidifontibacter sp. DB0510]|uniref:MFS transporter n=1 Tax=Metallococcus carri TaxID=1656884 RepID=A0A967EFW8_9MICO|nr:MFS transporter [Metallococcus carri]NHN54393.1 MFS transporter [Metallococcus carri]NOP36768.1 MFS transporter [Calidifontibacter sp. DB2511S]